MLFQVCVLESLCFAGEIQVCKSEDFSFTVGLLVSVSVLEVFS